MKQQAHFTRAIDWRSESPMLLGWQIKTIGHQWQKLGYIMIVLLCFCIIGLLAILMVGYKESATLLFPIVPFCIFSLFLFGEVRRKTWFVYRFTQYGAEIAHWRAYPKLLFVFIRWIFAIAGITIMFVGIALGQAALAMVGPLGVIMSIGTWAITKNYEETMTAFDIDSFGWCAIYKAEYDTKRDIIALFSEIKQTEEDRLRHINAGIDPDFMITKQIFYLFLTPAVKEQVLALTRKELHKHGLILETTKIILPETV